jgi:hypothetical protein
MCLGLLEVFILKLPSEYCRNSSNLLSVRGNDTEALDLILKLSLVREVLEVKLPLTVFEHALSCGLQSRPSVNLLHRHLERFSLFHSVTLDFETAERRGRVKPMRMKSTAKQAELVAWDVHGSNTTSSTSVAA